MRSSKSVSPLVSLSARFPANRCVACFPRDARKSPSPCLFAFQRTQKQGNRLMNGGYTLARPSAHAQSKNNPGTMASVLANRRAIFPWCRETVFFFFYKRRADADARYTFYGAKRQRMRFEASSTRSVPILRLVRSSENLNLCKAQFAT